MEKRKSLVEKLYNEQSTLVNLKMRIHFKRQLHERNSRITFGQKDVEKSEAKTSKVVEALDKKVERKERRMEQLVQELETNKINLDKLLDSNQGLRYQNAR